MTKPFCDVAGNWKGVWLTRSPAPFGTRGGRSNAQKIEDTLSLSKSGRSTGLEIPSITIWSRVRIDKFSWSTPVKNESIAFVSKVALRTRAMFFLIYWPTGIYISEKLWELHIFQTLWINASAFWFVRTLFLQLLFFGAKHYSACSEFAGARNYSGCILGLPLVSGVLVASSSAQCYSVGTGSLSRAQYSDCFGFRSCNFSGYTPGLLLVASVLVGVAMPLRIASMRINALLVEPWSNYQRYSQRWIKLIKFWYFLRQLWSVVFDLERRIVIALHIIIVSLNAC